MPRLKGGTVECFICGKLFHSLGQHIWKAHAMHGREYKIMFELPLGQSLASDELHDKQSINWEKKGLNHHLDRYNDYRKRFGWSHSSVKDEYSRKCLARNAAHLSKGNPKSTPMFSPEQQAEILQLYEHGFTKAWIARTYECHQATINRIIKGKR